LNLIDTWRRERVIDQIFLVFFFLINEKTKNKLGNTGYFTKIKFPINRLSYFITIKKQITIDT